jgi:hypothetical protein
MKGLLNIKIDGIIWHTCIASCTLWLHSGGFLVKVSFVSSTASRGQVQVRKRVHDSRGHNPGQSGRGQGQVQLTDRHRQTATHGQTDSEIKVRYRSGSGTSDRQTATRGQTKRQADMDRQTYII